MVKINNTVIAHVGNDVESKESLPIAEGSITLVQPVWKLVW